MSRTPTKAAPKRAAKQAPAAVPTKPATDAPHFTGEERECALSKVKPNTWNPNSMTPFMFNSFEHELRTTGWLRSYKLLVWGKDEKGVEQNIIIDGEHRWKVGRKLGFKVVPMVFLDGITEAEAKRLTIKARKQGTINMDDLSTLLQEPGVHMGMDIDSYALDMGFEVPEMSNLLHLDMIPATVAPVVEVSGHERTLPPTGVKGVAPNIRIPLVFYADTSKDADELRGAFAHPKREHEMDGTLLLRAARWMLSEHKSMFDKWRQERVQEVKAGK